MIKRSFIIICLILLGFVSGVAADDTQIAQAAQSPAGRILPAGSKSSVDTSWVQKKYLDVPYASLSATQKLDLYIPNEGSGPYPLIIEIHGGGFISGSKSSQISPMLEAVKKGYALASINYRLSAEAIWPAQINDVKAAIRFLRANAARYGLDPERFATWGASAGGSLSALAGVSGGVSKLADPALGNATVSDRVQAAVDWFGPIYFSTMDAEFSALGTSGAMGLTNAATSAESKYLGKVIGTPEAQPLVEAASPRSYISADDPPFFIQHGTADRNIPITQSIDFARALAQAIGGGKVVYEALEGAGHGGSQFESAQNVAKVIAFLDKVLR
ncbi:MAG TPA: alpha/beta hydrolase [Spirochaetaceae bacterium]|jgi:acetyl esterase/lipase|nr:alpha/beta hydrolase [Spirochaetaceae bacterium]